MALPEQRERLAALGIRIKMKKLCCSRDEYDQGTWQPQKNVYIDIVAYSPREKTHKSALSYSSTHASKREKQKEKEKKAQLLVDHGAVGVLISGACYGLDSYIL